MSDRPRDAGGSSYHDLAHVVPNPPPKNATEEEYRAHQNKHAGITLTEAQGWPARETAAWWQLRELLQMVGLKT